ncbi:fibroblast growth factor 23 [Thalassophryne amazonica]|uniref:fibroblast growth factor 23 n=1 Tax=Thalassophryne amazonica TaxID=390379 RepID=UPI001470A646|nr:fibroblast growth factor 23 [Thalassophryne amazonica]
MDVTGKLGMWDTVLALLLALLQGFPLDEAAPNASPLIGSNWGNTRRYVHLQTSTDLSNFYLEIKLDGTVRKTSARSSYSVISLKAETRQRVAIFGVKSSRYLCMDAQGTPFSSPTCLLEDCLFNHKLLENNHDVYYSSRTGILFNLEGSRQVYSEGQNLPQTSIFLPQKNTVPLERLLLHREKRNQVVDLTDPHNIYMGQAEEGSDSRAAPEDDADMEVEAGDAGDAVDAGDAGEEGRNVSRETPLAPSIHDPWNVYSSNLASPRSSGFMG